MDAVSMEACLGYEPAHGSHRPVGSAARGKVSVPVKVVLLVAVIILACLYPGFAAEASESAREVRDAIRRDEVAALTALLKKPGRLEDRNELGETPLMVAAQVGSPRMVRAMLDLGADVNATNAAGATALLRGAANPEVVKLLLDRGAQPNSASALGHTPLMLASRSPQATESVRLLLARGADVQATSRHGATALMAAVASMNGDVVRWLVERGADVNAVPMPSSPGVDPIWGGIRTPLMWAAYRGDLALAKYLLDRGAKAELVIPFGTALTHAGWRGDVAMAQFLVERGADVRAAEPFSGYTALHWAASMEDGDARLAAFLVGHGADPMAEGGLPVDAFLGEAQTPVALTRQRGETDLTRLLEGAGRRDVVAKVSVAEPGLVGSTDRLGVATAVASALPALQKTAEVSRESFLRHASRQNCVSCHQQYFPLAAVSEAQARGVSVDAAARQRLVDTVIQVHRGTGVDEEPLFHPDAPHDYGYALLSLKTAGVGATPETDVLVHHLAATQQKDGHWEVNLPRPPMQSSDITATALALHGLKHFGWPARAAEFEERIRLARGWLKAARALTHEELVYQVLGLHWAGVPRSELGGMLERLVSSQRANGGWAQLPGLESDAYATGQALYTLHEAGGYTAASPECGRAVRFLIATQGRDGTWRVRRRAFPFQPTMESGFPHGRDSWISAAGTSWAVMGLARVMAPLEGDEGRTIAQRVIGRRVTDDLRGKPVSVGEATVDFVHDVQPILERSCLPCHAGERARGQYRLTDRRSLLTPGNSGLPPLVAGKSADSMLLKYVTDEVADFAMPPVSKRGKFPALSSREVGLLRTWVESGAVWPEGLSLGITRTATAP
jgi:ankyrin repeat protein/mono/diheme cytochrome c family protein